MSERHGWVSERRVDDTKGVITCNCGHTEKYDLPSTEYAIEAERAKAVTAFEKHVGKPADKNDVHVAKTAQHDFANEKPASEQ